jgi:sugar-specific transcriptional regulator TrmB
MSSNLDSVNLTTKNVVNTLVKFGLSQNEAFIYLILVEHKELRIGQIVKLTNIPRSSVYESLKKIEELGLVETIIDHKFVRIKPYSVGVIKHKLNERLELIEEQLSELDGLEQSISLVANEKPESTIIRYYKGVSGARQLFWNTLSAKDTVFVYSAFGRSKFVGKKFYMDFVYESQKNNIKEKVLINPTERALNFIKNDTGTAVARTKVNDIHILEENNIIIEGETFIYNNIYAQIKLDGLEITGFEIESESFVKMQRSTFETLWNLSKPHTFIKSP